MGDSTVDAEIRIALRAWAERSGCHLCILFGSRATGGPSWRRDVDVAVDLAPLPGARDRLRRIGELQDALGTEEVDLTFLHRGTDPVLRFEVFRGAPVFEGRPGLFIDEKVRALMLYEDALPFRRLRRERLRRYVEEISRGS